MASRFGPAKPRGVTWKGAGGCVIVWQFRHENFSRTVWITFHCRGMTVMSSLSLDDRFRRPAAGTALRCGDHHALARQMIRERLARRPLALERFDRLGGRAAAFG
jgi:hypothetical protein